ncbi:hypothetical protein Taro_031192 [Colocasia esculenta]|uniref:Uncharacterized protein n=1 Tax=Colocasia esculenta TaxID=4460 RepID=A0A843W2E0_COLES|nr:hypothetical protein [Colocasia esculenta]
MSRLSRAEHDLLEPMEKIHAPQGRTIHRVMILSSKMPASSVRQSLSFDFNRSNPLQIVLLLRLLELTLVLLLALRWLGWTVLRLRCQHRLPPKKKKKRKHSLDYLKGAGIEKTSPSLHSDAAETDTPAPWRWLSPLPSPKCRKGVYRFYHGSVDTPIDGVDTGSESLKVFLEDRVKCVDTAPGSVDTSPRFQKTQFPDWDSVSTQPSQELSGRREQEREKGICIQRSRAALPREEEGEEEGEKEGEEEKELVIAAVLVKKEIQPKLKSIVIQRFEYFVLYFGAIVLWVGAIVLWCLSHSAKGLVNLLNSQVVCGVGVYRFCHGSVDTPIDGVDTGSESLKVFLEGRVKHPMQDKSQELSGRREQEREKGICIQRSRAAPRREEEGEKEGEEEKELVIAAVLVKKEIQLSLYLIMLEDLFSNVLVLAELGSIVIQRFEYFALCFGAVVLWVGAIVLWCLAVVLKGL